MSRYLQPKPGGVLAWLSVSSPSVERCLFEHLLGAPEAVELNVKALAATLRHPVQSVAQALFALNRHASIAVHDDAKALSRDAILAMSQGRRRGIASLDQDLVEISQDKGEVLLASEDGFCIARAGMDAKRAQWLAAQLSLGRGPATSFQVAFSFGRRTLHFCASPDVDLDHPAMLRLGAHLMQSCHWPSALTGN